MPPSSSSFGRLGHVRSFAGGNWPHEGQTRRARARCGVPCARIPKRARGSIADKAGGSRLSHLRGRAPEQAGICGPTGRTCLFASQLRTEAAAEPLPAWAVSPRPSREYQPKGVVSQPDANREVGRRGPGRRRHGERSEGGCASGGAQPGHAPTGERSAGRNRAAACAAGLVLWC
jgi:hypothetical protein